ncbi:Uncharacterised protein [Mycobacteroides abscessus subsp. abscessus]|nr:Uncharacterised protein [Mycobacteroides abscessus subsp. abscessus]
MASFMSTAASPRSSSERTYSVISSSPSVISLTADSQSSACLGSSPSGTSMSSTSSTRCSSAMDDTAGTPAFTHWSCSTPVMPVGPS